jgi:hypothetical protein
MILIAKVAAVVGCATALAAYAQPRADAAADPAAASPPLQYRSAFVGYRPLGDVGPGGWREVNDRVREAAEAAAKAFATPAPAPSTGPAPSPPPPGGHAHGGAKP